MKSRIILLSSIIVTLAISNAAFAKETTTDINDGPYITINNAKNQLESQWVCQSKKFSETIAISKLPYSFNRCNLSATVESIQSPAATLDVHEDIKIAAISDIHGQHQLLLKLLRNNKIINSDGAWIFNNGHFVITGDVFDRGDQVTQSLWFLYELEQQAKRAGGRVHLLLGNHEVMVLNNDLRYLHPNYPKVASLLDTPFVQLFDNSSVLGRWLRAKPVAIRINNLLFAHGGFHPSLVTKNLTVTDINNIFTKNLIKSELASPRQGIGKFLHKTNGPIWYRGFFAGDEGIRVKDKDVATQSQFSALLEHFAVDYFVVGHTSQQAIETRYNGRVIAIDSSMKRGKNAEILFIDNSGNRASQKLSRGLLSGETIPLVSQLK